MLRWLRSLLVGRLAKTPADRQPSPAFDSRLEVQTNIAMLKMRARQERERAVFLQTGVRIPRSDFQREFDSHLEGLSARLAEADEAAARQIEQQHGEQLRIEHRRQQEAAEAAHRHEQAAREAARIEAEKELVQQVRAAVVLDPGKDHSSA